MPPAEPTTAMTWIARGSAVGAIRPRQEAVQPDRAVCVCDFEAHLSTAILAHVVRLCPTAAGRNCVSAAGSAGSLAA